MLKCLYLVWNIRKFRHYLVGNTFEIYTDHYSLQLLRYIYDQDRKIFEETTRSAQAASKGQTNGQESCHWAD